ncbi:MAG: hypothetical protein AB7D05_05205 [Mangrovibacterium sp.]
MGYLLKLLLYGLIIYWVIRFFGRQLRRLFGVPGEASRQNRPQENRRPEGEVRVEQPKHTGSRYSREEGEYVDFEEIDKQGDEAKHR